MMGRFEEMVVLIPGKRKNHHCSGSRLPNVIPSIVTNLTLLDYFLILFHMDYIKVTLLPEMN